MSTKELPLVEFLSATRMGKKGRLTLPKAYRDATGLAPGAEVAILRIGDALILMPEQARVEVLCDSIRRALEGANINEANLRQTLPEARGRIFARRYPNLMGDTTVTGKRRR
jgi:AbrB family looped-hinge helix DNA binding protein